ncbi:MAG: sensor histidine kinase, partial [Huintestinicola sp.]
MSRNKATRVTKKQIFLNKLISTFFVCALFAAAIVLTIVIYIRGEMFSGSYQIAEIMREAFAKDIGGKAFARMIVTGASYHDDEMDSFTAIYDENGEYYICPEDTVTLRVSKDSEADFHFYDLADSAKNSLDELKEKYKPGQGNDDVVYLTNPYTLTRFCLIDETFIPLEVVVTDNDKTETIVIDAEIPEGAEIYTSDMVTQANLLFYYAEVDKDDFSYISQRIISNQSLVTDFNSITNISRIEIDGKDYFIGETMILNIGFIVKRAIVVILPITLLVFIIIAILRTSKEYAVLSAHYEIEDQRREMTDRLAHDLKSPLMVISGYAENLSENVNPENRQHYAEAILENVKYMDNIIADVLDLSKLEDGAVKINSEAFDAAEMIRELGANYEECFRKNDVKFTCEGSA